MKIDMKTLISDDLLVPVFNVVNIQQYSIFNIQYSTMTSDIYGSKKARKRNPDKFTRRIDIQIKFTLVEREEIQLSNDIKIII